MSYTALANITTTSTVSSITFSSISQAYRDLVVVMYFSHSGSAGGRIRLNSDSGTYEQVWLQNNNTDLRGELYSIDGLESGFQNVSGTRYFAKLEVMDYSQTNKRKSLLLRASSQDPSETIIRSGIWHNTAAVNSITIPSAGSTFQVGSTFALYGIEG